MERRVTGNCHARCGAGEKLEMTSKAYLSLLGTIPDFENVISYVRSYEISVNIILQSLSQLKAGYKEHMNTIIGNCDSKLFLGGDDEETLKYLTRVIGKETIDMMDNSETTGKSGSYSKSYKKSGRELMTTDELARLDGGKCLLILRGVAPFLSNKFDVTAHPMYQKMQGGGQLNKKPQVRPAGKISPAPKTAPRTTQTGTHRTKK